MKFCPECGGKIEPNWKLCPVCGGDLTKYMKSSTSISLGDANIRANINQTVTTTEQSAVGDFGDSGDMVVKIGDANVRSTVNMVKNINVQGMDEQQYDAMMQKMDLILEQMGLQKTTTKDTKLEISAGAKKVIDAVKSKVEEGEEHFDKPVGNPDTYLRLGNVDELEGRLKDAMENYEKALALYQESSDKEGISTCYNQIGLVLDIWGKPEQALEYYQKALRIDEELGDKKNIATYYNNIGMIYDGWGKPEQALEYYQKALRIGEELGDKRGMAVDYNNIGSIYKGWGKPEQALEYYQKALKIFEVIGDVRSAEVVRENAESVQQSLGE